MTADALWTTARIDAQPSRCPYDPTIRQRSAKRAEARAGSRCATHISPGRGWPRHPHEQACTTSKPLRELRVVLCTASDLTPRKETAG